MQEVNDRFKKELETFLDFLDKRYPNQTKCWDIMYAEDDFAYIMYVFDKESFKKKADKKILGTFSLNNSSAFEPALDLEDYKDYILRAAAEAGISPVSTL